MENFKEISVLSEICHFFHRPPHALLTVIKQQQDRSRPTKKGSEVCALRQMFLCALVRNVERLVRNRIMRKQACPSSPQERTKISYFRPTSWTSASQRSANVMHC
jgi:hypothetical protein